VAALSPPLRVSVLVVLAALVAAGAATVLIATRLIRRRLGSMTGRRRSG
jgi:hypothetical protein